MSLTNLSLQVDHFAHGKWILKRQNSKSRAKGFFFRYKFLLFEPLASFALISTDSTCLITFNLYPQDKKYFKDHVPRSYIRLRCFHKQRRLLGSFFVTFFVARRTLWSMSFVVCWCCWHWMKLISRCHHSPSRLDALANYIYLDTKLIVPGLNWFKSRLDFS